MTHVNSGDTERKWGNLMPATDGFLSIDEAVAKWGRSRAWWYGEVSSGRLTGYTIPGVKGTYLRVEDAEAHIKPRAKDVRDAGTGHQAG